MVRRDAALIIVTLERSSMMMLPYESIAVTLLRFLSIPSIPLHFIVDVSFEKEIQTLEAVRVAQRNLIFGCLRTSNT
jgi:hypothetical protein